MPSRRTVAVVLTDDLKAKLEAVARRDTTSISAVVRQALQAYFSARNVRHTNVDDTNGTPLNGEATA